ncbi:unnamed protein product [Discula destructiva]
MDMYAQRAALQQAMEAAKQTDQANKQTEEANKLTAEGLKQTEAGNRMARSSGQLTKIATVIVPCSFVASIFSMGDEFAAGKSLFYVYWVISMPTTAVLLFWVLCGEWVLQRWKAADEQCVQVEAAWFYTRLKSRIFPHKAASRSKSRPEVDEANWAEIKRSA